MVTIQLALNLAIIAGCTYAVYRLFVALTLRGQARAEMVGRAAAPLLLDDNHTALRQVHPMATHPGRVSPDGAAAPDTNPWARGPDDRPLP